MARDDLDNLGWWEQPGRGAVNAVGRGVKQIGVAADQIPANLLAQRAADKNRDFGAILADESKRTYDGLALIYAGWRQTAAMLDSAFGNDVEAKAAWHQQRAAETSAKLAVIPKTANAKAIDGWIKAMDWSSPYVLSNVIQNVALNPMGFAEWVNRLLRVRSPHGAGSSATS